MSIDLRIVGEVLNCQWKEGGLYLKWWGFTGHIPSLLSFWKCTPFHSVPTWLVSDFLWDLSYNTHISLNELSQHPIQKKLQIQKIATLLLLSVVLYGMASTKTENYEKVQHAICTQKEWVSTCSKTYLYHTVEPTSSFSFCFIGHTYILLSSLLFNLRLNGIRYSVKNSTCSFYNLPLQHLMTFNFVSQYLL